LPSAVRPRDFNRDASLILIGSDRETQEAATMALTVNHWPEPREQIGRVPEAPTVSIGKAFYGFGFREHARPQFRLPTPQRRTLE
jgi:hypothetical protein